MGNLLRSRARLAGDGKRRRIHKCIRMNKIDALRNVYMRKAIVQLKCPFGNFLQPLIQRDINQRIGQEALPAYFPDRRGQRDRHNVRAGNRTAANDLHAFRNPDDFCVPLTAVQQPVPDDHQIALCRQPRSLIQRVLPDFLHGIGNIQIGQRRTGVKSALFNADELLRQADGFQMLAASKDALRKRLNAAAKAYFFQCRHPVTELLRKCGHGIRNRHRTDILTGLVH